MRRKILSPAVGPTATRSAAPQFAMPVRQSGPELSMLEQLGEAARPGQRRCRRQIRKTAKAFANLPCLRANRDRSAGNVQHEVLREPDLQEMRPDWLRPG